MRFDSHFAGYNAYPYPSLYSGMVVFSQTPVRKLGQLMNNYK